jgi:hypothetical protein
VKSELDESGGRDQDQNIPSIGETEMLHVARMSNREKKKAKNQSSISNHEKRNESPSRNAPS